MTKCLCHKGLSTTCSLHDNGKVKLELKGAYILIKIERDTLRNRVLEMIG